MKHLYIIIAWLCFLTSCERIIEYESATDHKLVMNATIDAANTTNYVYIGLSGGEEISHVDKAEVELFVNGEPCEFLQDVTDETSFVQVDSDKYEGFHAIMDDYEISRLRKFIMKTPLKSGDDIRLVATGEKDGTVYKASAQTQIPDRPNEISVETKFLAETTTTLKNKIYDQTEYKIHVKDTKNQKNYYRIGICAEVECWRSVLIPYDNNWGYLYVDSICNEWVVDELENNYDVILNHGQTGNNEDLSTLFPYVKNRYAVFSDELFPNSEADVTVQTKVLKRELSTSNMKPIFYIISRNTYVKLCQLTADGYRYYEALNQLMDDNYEPALMDPIVLPTNVEGGLGFVSAENSTYTTLYKSY